MEIREITSEEYKKIVLKPYSAFDTVDFVELNRHKVDDLKYLLFADGKPRFALIVGIKDGIVKVPFSASFSCFTNLVADNKITYYHQAVNLLNNWAKTCNYKSIRFSLPSHCYSPTYLTCIYNALFVNDYKVEVDDISYEYYLKNFDDDYINKIQYNARKALKNSLKNNLTFEKTEDVESVYNVIKNNRNSKGFPLWMSMDDVKNTIKIIESDMFIVRDSEGSPIASALVYHLTDEIVRVIYWGNVAGSEELRPMNFIAFKVFEYYSKTNIKIIDIGQATEDSIPNWGLCDFKQSIGCDCSSKYIFNFLVK